jgi:hypothetical protein
MTNICKKVCKCRCFSGDLNLTVHCLCTRMIHRVALNNFPFMLGETGALVKKLVSKQNAFSLIYMLSIIYCSMVFLWVDAWSRQFQGGSVMRRNNWASGQHMDPLVYLYETTTYKDLA